MCHRDVDERYMDIDHFYHVLVSNHAHICDNYPSCNHHSDHPFDSHLADSNSDRTRNDHSILADRHPETVAFVDFYHVGRHYVILSALREPQLPRGHYFRTVRLYVPSNGKLDNVYVMCIPP